MQITPCDANDTAAATEGCSGSEAAEAELYVEGTDLMPCICACNASSASQIPSTSRICGGPVAASPLACGVAPLGVLVIPAVLALPAVLDEAMIPAVVALLAVAHSRIDANIDAPC